MTLTQELTTSEGVLHRCVVKDDGSFTIYTYDAYWQMPNMLPMTNDNSPGIKFCPYCGKRLGEQSISDKITQDYIGSALNYCISKRTENTTQGYIDNMRRIEQSLGTSVQVTVIHTDAGHSSE